MWEMFGGALVLLVGVFVGNSLGRPGKPKPPYESQIDI